ncbi:MAG: TolC family protein, partial [Methyloglobulus sp.]|nr:TolC family protein [Methyloglobulus sp.]
MKTRILFVSWLLSWPFTACWGTDGMLEDPFATRQQASESPGKKHLAVEDPCRLNTVADHAWTLVDIIYQALCHNPQTRQAWANARFQAGQVGIAKAAYLPNVTLNTSVSRSMNSASSNLQNNIISNPGTGGTGGGGQALNRFTSIISLNYLLYNFGAREAQLENAQQTLEAANWTHDAVLQTVMFTAIQAYYQVFATQSAAEAALVSEKASNESLKAAQTRYEVGVVAKADALQAQTAFAQAKLNRQKTEGEARIATGTLANALGLEADYHLKITTPYLSKPDAEQDTFVHQLIEEAKSMRPDLAAAEATVKAAEANVKAAEAGHLPSISLIGNYGYNHTSLPSDTQSWSVGMQVSVPLFTGFNMTYQIRSAKEKLEVERANLDQLDQSVSLDVWRAYQLLNTARESFLSSEDLLVSAKQSERVALGR